MVTGLIIALSLGLLVLGFTKFNTWTSDEKKHEPYENPPRHFTTWWRFNCYALLYSSAMIGLFLLCVSFPDLVVLLADSLLKLKLQSPEAFQKIPEDLRSVIYGMVIYIPVHAFLLRYDNPWRRWVHEQAFIPDHAKALIKNFKTNPLTFKPKIDDLRTILKADNRLAPQLRDDACNHYESQLSLRRSADAIAVQSPSEPFSSIRDVIRAWAKILYIKTKIDSILIGQEAVKCLNKCKNQRSGLDNDYNQLSALLVIYFALNPIGDETEIKIKSASKILRDKSNIEKLKSLKDPDIIDAVNVLTEEKSDEKRIKAIKILDKEIKDTAQKTLAKLYLIACCAVLRLTKSERKRSHLFKQLGLVASFEPPPEALPITTIVQGLAGVLLMGLLGTTWFQTLFNGEAFNLLFELGGKNFVMPLVPEDSINTLVWPFYILILHGLAIFIGMASVRLTYRMQHGMRPMEWDSDLETTKAWTMAVIATFIICSGFLLGIVSASSIYLLPGDEVPKNIHMLADINSLEGVSEVHVPFLFALKFACIWSLVPSVTAFFSVIYLNATVHQEKYATPRQKVLRASYQGLLTGIMGFIAVTVFLGFIDFKEEKESVEQSLMYFSIYAIGMTAAVGLLLGYLLPNGYENHLRRDSRERRKEVRQEARSENLPAWVG